MKFTHTICSGIVLALSAAATAQMGTTQNIVVPVGGLYSSSTTYNCGFTIASVTNNPNGIASLNTKTLAQGPNTTAFSFTVTGVGVGSAVATITPSNTTCFAGLTLNIQVVQAPPLQIPGG